ncbi:5-oxoprolinase subunit A, partial [Frankliniella fusca]
MQNWQPFKWNQTGADSTLRHRRRKASTSDDPLSPLSLKLKFVRCSRQLRMLPCPAATCCRCCHLPQPGAAGAAWLSFGKGEKQGEG